MPDLPQDASERVSPRRGRPGLLMILALATVVVAALWLALQIWLHLLGIAASPLGWLLSLLGTLAGFVPGRFG